MLLRVRAQQGMGDPGLFGKIFGAAKGLIGKLGKLKQPLAGSLAQGTPLGAIAGAVQDTMFGPGKLDPNDPFGFGTMKPGAPGAALGRPRRGGGMRVGQRRRTNWANPRALGRAERRLGSFIHHFTKTARFLGMHVGRAPRHHRKRPAVGRRRKAA